MKKVCPRCNLPQKGIDECQYCGLDFSKKYENRKSESTLFDYALLIPFWIVVSFICLVLLIGEPFVLIPFFGLVVIIWFAAKITEKSRDPNKIPGRVVDEVFQRDQAECINCGANRGITIHQITPVSEGGKHTTSNLFLLCEECSKNKDEIIAELKAGESDIEPIFNQDDKTGYIYILINASLQENFLKIGRTKRHPRERAKELSAPTGVPSEFIVAYSKMVLDDKKAESLIHQKLKKFRSTDIRKDRNREFFILPLEKAIEIIEDVIQKVGQPINRGSALA
jgi:hypothetical protein